MDNLPDRLDKETLALTVAFLKANGISKQEDIAKELGISQSLVSARLKYARTRGWLKTTVTLTSAVPAEIHGRVKSRFDLAPRLNEHLRAVTKVRCKAWTCAAEGGQLLATAAKTLSGIIQASNQVGVSWGKTLAEVCNQLTATASETRPIEFCPISGEPIHLTHYDEDRRYQSTALAIALQRHFAGESKGVPVLDAVPAYVRSNLSNQVIKFIEQIPGYRKVFLGDDHADPIIDTVDTILTGVGLVSESGMGTFVRERVYQEEIDVEQIRQVVMGDLAGVLIGKPDLSAKDKRRVRTWNDCFVGLKLDHLVQCSQRASDKGTAGVVIFAFGPVEKALLIKRIVELGMCNTLIVSNPIATELIELWEQN